MRSWGITIERMGDMTALLPDYPAEFWVTAILAVTLIGISKAGFGAGIAVVATPLVALTISAADAAALLLPLLIVADMLAIGQYRNCFDRRNLAVLIPGSIVGIVLGWWFFGYFLDNERMLKIGIGILAASFVLFQIGRRLIFGLIEKRTPNPVEGMFWGTVSGFVSTLAHAGGPPIMIHLLPQKLARDRYVGTVAIFFTITNLVKLIPYAQLGMIRVGNFYTIALLAPLAYIGVKIGKQLNARFSDQWFNRAIYTILALTAVQLIVGKSMISMINNLL